jgi:hypothetical protein
MHHRSACIGAAVLAVFAGSPVVAERIVAPFPEPGIYSNEEQVYFAKEAGQPAPPIVMLRVDAAHQIRPVDAFGVDTVANMYSNSVEVDGTDIRAELKDGTALKLRRARPATCWVAIRKDKPKADGSPDWFFASGVKLHDQGGRALVGKDAPDTQPVVIRMRNVVWPPKPDGTPSTNKPSVVLYVHKPDEPDRSEAYAWADPGAARVGINLRWMQASCGIDGMEQPSAVTATSFRG